MDGLELVDQGLELFTPRLAAAAARMGGISWSLKETGGDDAPQRKTALRMTCIQPLSEWTTGRRHECPRVRVGGHHHNTGSRPESRGGCRPVGYVCVGRTHTCSGGMYMGPAQRWRHS